MKEFSTSLVREKIEFTDAGKESATPAVVRSNRIFLRLPSFEQPGIFDKVVIRTQTMPTALRLASRAMYSYFHNGLFSTRAESYDWEMQWEGCLSGYDRAYTPDLWAAVYVNGHSAFKTLHSPFVDIVEKCALLHIDNYDVSMGTTEELLSRLGMPLKVSHASVVAAVFNDMGPETSCGIIQRIDGQDATFSFMASGGDMGRRIVQSLGIAGAFIESVNLQRVMQITREKIRLREVAKASPEATRLRAATARMTAIDKAINSFEDIYSVKYRPAKPDFFGRDKGGL
jgi:hypothetical protein